MMDSEESFLCHHCGKLFYRLSTLESHTKWKHMEKSNEFMCDQCGKTFQKKYNLLKHLDSGIHDVLQTVKCALCDFRSQNRKIMGEHYKRSHEVSLKESNEYFKTAEEFFRWKSEFESITKSRFVKMSSSRKRKNGYIRSTYFCHRDGNFIPKGRNLRHLKVKGSNKINAHCPAKMEVDIGERIVIVSYINTHLGHEMDISRMTLDHLDRADIAKKIARRVPFEQILDEINSLPKDSELKRVNYLTRKDLWNIVDTFKLNPKNVVYSKTRMRRKKKTENNKKEPKIKRGNYIYSSQKSNKIDETKIIVNNGEAIECTNGKVITVNHEGEEKMIICPVVKEENDGYIQEYAVISDENNTGDAGTYYIINSEGELESISGHHVIYTEDGDINICDSSSEAGKEELNQSVYLVPENLTEEEVSELVHMNDGEYSKTLKIEHITHKKKQHELSSVIVKDEFAVNGDISDGETIQFLSEEDINVEVSPEKNEFNLEVLKGQKRGNCSELQLEDNSNNYPVRNHLITVRDEELKVETDPEYEVTEENYEVDEKEFFIISTDEDFSESTVVSNKVNIENKFGQIDYPPFKALKRVTVKEEVPEESTVEEGIDMYDNDKEECISVYKEEPQWNEKRKEALDKLLNVHNMINNEQQLKIFSKNISSLEHVLKALSKSNQTIPDSSESESLYEKSNENKIPKGVSR